MDCYGVKVQHYLVLFFLLNIPSPQADILTLNVLGKHYDTASPHILNLDQSIWNTIQSMKSKNGLVYLSTTLVDASKGDFSDKTWKVRFLEGRAVKTELEISSNANSILIHDTGIGIEEPLFDASDVVANMMRTNVLRDILPIQMDRKIKIRKT